MWGWPEAIEVLSELENLTGGCPVMRRTARVREDGLEYPKRSQISGTVASSRSSIFLANLRRTVSNSREKEVFSSAKRRCRVRTLIFVAVEILSIVGSPPYKRLSSTGRIDPARDLSSARGECLVSRGFVVGLWRRHETAYPQLRLLSSP